MAGTSEKRERAAATGYRKTAIGLIAFSAALVALLWVGFALVSSREHDQIVENQLTQNLNLARTFAENITRTIARADADLRDLAAGYRRSGAKFDIAGFARQRKGAGEPFTVFSAVDASGDAVLLDPMTEASLNFSQSDNYKFHRERDTDELFISAPRKGATVDKWQFFVSRRINARDGTFAGFVSVGLDAEFLGSLYGEVDLGKDALLALVGRDGVVRARRSNESMSAGQRLARITFSQEVLAKAEGTLIVTSSIDAVRRFESFRAVRNYPLVVLVGTSEAVALAHFYERRTRAAGLLALMTFFILAFSLMAVLQLRRRGRSERLQRQSEEQRKRERLAADHALHERESKLRLIADNVPVMIAYSDAENRYQYANRACAAFYSRTGEGFEGRMMAEVLGAELYDAVRPNVERALAGETVRYDAVRRAPDGTLHLVEVTLVPHREAGGPVLGMYTLIQDVTESRRAAEKLREGEKQFRLLTDSVPVLIAHLDEEFRFLYANRGYRTFFLGESAPSLEGKPMREVTAPEAWREIRPFLERARQGESCSYTVKRPRKSDGGIREMDVSLVPHRDETGKVVGLYVLLIDVTERRRTEESLRLSSRALESSLNSVNITRIGEAGLEIVYVNPSFERITGYSAAEVVGKDPWFLHGEDRDQAGLDVLRRAVQARSEATVLLRNYRKDGTLFWNELRVAPILDEAGRVTHILGVGNDVTERVRYQEQVEHSANFDALTGLANRNLLNDRIAQAIAHASRSGKPMAVLFVDLDQLKRINDSLGHEMGDKVIVAVGKRITGALRSGDSVARLGGDEFVALLPDLKNEDDAAAVANKVLNFIDTPIRIEAHEFALTASIGVSLYPKDGIDAGTLFRHADMALYRAKEEGRNCFRFFAAEMNERIMPFVDLEHDLRRALKERQFELHYQPIVSLADRRRVGAEALLRWRRPDGSMVSPAQFIPVAEDAGLIVPIGEWVMERAMRQAAEWNRSGRERLYVSINLSLRQFRDTGLVDTVRANLERSGIDPALVTLEITESAVMQNAEQTIELLGALKALGVKLSLDDFGTGYSSLAYLKRFPIDVLKIDRAFVRDVVTSRGDQALSRTIIELGRSLGIAVVAEGIETEEQARFLEKSGCAFAQGYLYGKPMDAASFRSPVALAEGAS